MAEMVLLANGYEDDYPLVEKWTVPPNIRLEDGCLCYDPYPRNPKDWQWAKPANARLLWDFVQLAEANDKAILAYARQWGVLALCRHRMPASIFYGFHSDDKPPGSPLEGCEAILCEPLNCWRDLAHIFENLLGQIEHDRANPVKATETTHKVNRMAANWGHLRPVLVHTNTGELVIRLSGSFLDGGLPAALSYQLMVSWAGGKGLYTCAECGRWFKPRQGQNLRQSTYCSRCGRGAAQRAASRRYYQRRKQRLINTTRMGK